jgi:phosphatidylserine/phosphatidylglycerophosphate/cardiolipin synthase-like enzyme
MKNFGKPLCLNCQTIKRDDSLRSSSTKHAIPSKQKHTEEEQEVDIIAGVQKVMRGVTHIIREASIKKETDFNKWTADWRHTRRLDFSMESRHFFLDGMDLDDFTKQLIKMAEKTILVANPYLESCYLTDALIDSATKQTEIRIITRPPEARETRKAECHSKLRKMGIILRYDKQIHSKIITVDNQIAIVSSMNFYSGSSGGASKEAGIVSIDEKVVESATNYIRKLLDGP